MSTVDDKVEHNLSPFNSSLSSSYYLNMVFMEIKNLYRIEKVLFASLILGSLFVFMILSDNPTTISSKYAIKNTSIPPNRPRIDFNNPLEREILGDEARLVPGLGHGGKPIKLNQLQATISDIFLKKFAVNIFLSDRIPYNRTLQDFRNPKCMDIVYDAELPSTSIIIPLHNEVYSVVVRMLWGIINSVLRTNPVYDLANYVTANGEKMQLGSKGQAPDSQLLYLKEIILVDDQSSSGKFRKKLDYYVKTRMPAGLVKMVASKKRVGLIRARMEGARRATGDVIVFLDAHCEVQNDWLRPLLQNLKDNSTIVLFPIIDTIDIPDFAYSASESFAIGGFAVDGDFAFLDVSEREKKRRGSDIALTWSPTMAGGLFAMRRSYFWHLGGYDEQMRIWGGENLEMSFRIWQCGGTLAATPCSRVGHLFRPFHPYARDSATGSTDPMDTVVLNAARMAEVWMDEYSESFYLYRPTYRNNPIVGNVTERQMLRKKLNCKSFRWFLENIFPEKYVPGADSVGFGRFLNPITKTCLKNIHEMTYPFPLKTEACGSILAPLLFLSLTLQGQIRDEYRCLFVRDFKPIKEVYFEECKVNKKSQKWIYHPDTRHLQHVLSELCLEAPLKEGSIPLAVPCNVTRKEQIWFIEYSNASLQYRHTIKHEEAQAQRLAKLAGHEVVHVNITKYTELAPELIDY